MQEVNMNLVRVLVTSMAVCFGIAFLAGVFTWVLPTGLYVVLGLIEIVSLVWLLKIAYAKKPTCVGGCCDCNNCQDC